MPIRHCQKCRLKVLVDESQTTVNPFFCQRCAASASTPGDIGAPEAPAPARQSTSTVAVATGSPAKGGPVKVLCPYCKASFSGRLPTKPAKGACPVCQKELILLPDGKIKPAAAFDLAGRQKEQEKASNGEDMGLPEPVPVVPKPPEAPESAQVQAAPAASVEEPPPAAAPEPGATEIQIPPAPEPSQESTLVVPPRPPGQDTLGGLVSETMLDMGRPAEVDEMACDIPTRKVQQKEDKDPLAGVNLDSSVPAEAPPEAVPSVPAEEVPKEPEPSEVPTVIQTPQEPTIPEPPPTPTPFPVPAPAIPPPVPKPVQGAAPRRAGPHPVAKVMGVVLLVLPLAAGGVAFFLRNNASVNELLTRVAWIATRGFKQVHAEVIGDAWPPAPRKEEAPQPSTARPSHAEREREKAKSELETEIQREWAAMRAADRAIKLLDRDPTDGQKKLIEMQKEKLERAKRRYDKLQADYQRFFGGAFQPQSE
ncbi:MAG: hypothetical protein HYY16_04005 [Planctomycetes bacterium]|nr:hypothetical protein [Planctomycetota bacterium]